ncbi:hypothetical protein Z945_3837 [Sulfitobacter noctilucae]|nr:hypothetical protein Z945_3837 [Sulfitobacter noctilucae]
MSTLSASYQFVLPAANGCDVSIAIRQGWASIAETGHIDQQY